jgi:hypothetical protein
MGYPKYRWLADATVAANSDAITISPSFFYQSYKYGDSDAFYPPGQLSSTNPAGPPIPGLWIQDKETPEPGMDTLVLPSLTMNAKLGFADLTSVGGGNHAQGAL